jgi:hypothetical protein
MADVQTSTGFDTPAPPAEAAGRIDLFDFQDEMELLRDVAVTLRLLSIANHYEPEQVGYSDAMYLLYRVIEDDCLDPMDRALERHCAQKQAARKVRGELP